MPHSGSLKLHDAANELADLLKKLILSGELVLMPGCYEVQTRDAAEALEAITESPSNFVLHSNYIQGSNSNKIPTGARKITDSVSVLFE
jgi:hypothetical protein